MLNRSDCYLKVLDGLNGDRFVLAHPTGAIHSRIMLRALVRTKRLQLFLTLVALPPFVLKMAFLPRIVRRELSRRVFDVPSSRVMTAPFREVRALFAERLPLGKRARQWAQNYRACAMNTHFDTFTSVVLDRLDPSNLTFYGYVDSAAKSAITARQRGMRTIIELTNPWIPFDQELFKVDALRTPAWADLLPTSMSVLRTGRQVDALTAADVIVCPSSFVQRSLPAELRAKSVISYYDLFSTAERQFSKQFNRRDGRLKVLFVGSLTQRKGLSYLAEAMRDCAGFADLTIVGNAPLLTNRELLKLLARSTWHSSLPNVAIQELMAVSDVLVLPSISEAFGLVVGEALVQGTTVIVSDRVGAGELVDHGINGYVVTNSSSTAISDVLYNMNADRQHLRCLGVSAAATFAGAGRNLSFD